MGVGEGVHVAAGVAVNVGVAAGEGAEGAQQRLAAVPLVQKARNAKARVRAKASRGGVVECEARQLPGQDVAFMYRRINVAGGRDEPRHVGAAVPGLHELVVQANADAVIAHADALSAFPKPLGWFVSSR